MSYTTIPCAAEKLFLRSKMKKGGLLSSSILKSRKKTKTTSGFYTISISFVFINKKKKHFCCCHAMLTLHYFFLLFKSPEINHPGDFMFLLWFGEEFFHSAFSKLRNFSIQHSANGWGIFHSTFRKWVGHHISEHNPLSIRRSFWMFLQL